MRIWQVDDVRAIPGNIVREQDFVMRLRHLNRHATKVVVLNVSFHSVPELRADISKREQCQVDVARLSEKHGCTVHVMSDGDMFIVLPNIDDGALEQFLVPLHKLVAPNTERATAEYIHTYHLPKEYDAARERSNHYIESARAATQLGSDQESPEQALKGEMVRGELSAWALDQIERLISDIDLRRYVRQQKIYKQQQGAWLCSGVEYFVSVDAIRQERFPRLEIRQPESLFLQLCAALDKSLLSQFAKSPESLPTGQMNFNIAAETILASVFVQFVRAIPVARRKDITFEINRGDLFLNFSTTQAAFELLRKEGFGIAIDSLSPAILPYMNVQNFDADFYKLRVNKEVLADFKNDDVKAAVQKLSPEKLVFYRCDNPEALALGEELSVKHFQGWLIDDQNLP